MRGPWLESFTPRGAPIVLRWNRDNPGPTFAREFERVCFALETTCDPRPHLWDLWGPDLLADWERNR